MKRFWFEFDFNDSQYIPPGLRMGCGVTALDYNDAISIIKAKVFINQEIPNANKIIENIDISKLDTGHILPNMSSPNIRGIWFPLGYT